MRIDPHVHCRDGNQAYKSTIARVFEIAEQQGVEIIFDMPNTDPPIVDEESLFKRLKLIPEDKRGKYFLWLGLTANEDQIKEAVEIYNEPYCPEVIGFKLYAGESTGDLAVVGLKKQSEIYKALVGLDYKGVLAVHCERKDLLKPELWNVLNPISHSQARPKEAEIEAVRDQIKFANQASFKGALHIVHVSCAESVKLIREARRNIKITCGVTPHHILFNQEMQIGKNGAIYKMNPPLRSMEDIKALRYCLLRREIDWIETDHAPHSLDEKLFSKDPPSGFPSLCLYKYFVEKFLPGPAVSASKELIEEMTFSNIVKTFLDKLGGAI